MELAGSEWWQYPGGPPGRVLRACLVAATEAASVHNTQPWRLHSRDGGVDLQLDRNRRLDVIDPTGRAAVMSVGAALLNLRVAVRDHGRTPVLRLRPTYDRAGVLARVAIGVPVGHSETARQLARAIPRRHTNRRPFTDVPIPVEVRAELVAAAAAEDATLSFLDASSTSTVLALVRTAENRWRHDPRYWAELDRWTRGLADRRDGVPAAAFGPRPEHDSIPLRDFGLSTASRNRRTEPFEARPTVAVLYTVGDGVRQWLRAGQALQRVMLTATVRGVATSPMTQPLELADLRSLLVDGGVWYPQVILRLGYGPQAAASPRRPLSDVLSTGGQDVRPRGDVDNPYDRGGG